MTNYLNEGTCKRLVEMAILRGRIVRVLNETKSIKAKAKELMLYNERKMT